MKKGITNAIIFYGVGLGITGLTYLIFGAAAGHGPGLWILVPFLTFLIGLFWTGSTLFNYFFKNKTDERRGIIYSNIVVIIIVIVTVLYSRSQIDHSDTTDIKKEELSTSQNGDTTSIMLNNKIIYLKIKDSVLVDKRDFYSDK